MAMFFVIPFTTFEKILGVKNNIVLEAKLYWSRTVQGFQLALGGARFQLVLSTFM